MGDPRGRSDATGESEVTTHERPITRAAAPEQAVLRLEVVAGPDAGKVLELGAATPGRVFVGTSTACELTLTDPLVSRRHLALEVDARGVRLTDLDSTNGTAVNGVDVIEAFVHGGELVRVGDTSLAVRAGTAARAEPAGDGCFGRVLGASAEMRRLYPLCERLARSTIPIVLEGETGTGKELLAEAIHEMSDRARGPFVVFDCTTSPPNLLEAKLFGHEKGAFTGAVTARPGVFEEASGGTLLIDEIGDLDVTLQAKLLRAVQSGQVQRLGGTRWIQTDVRLLAATRRDLEREIQAGRFRDDLYYRLAAARIELPPLRRRRGDLALLAREFWVKLAPTGAEFPEDFLDRLAGYAWPGNVRELYNAVMNRAALGELSDIGGLRRSTRPPSDPSGSASDATAFDVIADVIARELPFPRARQDVLEAFEERYVDALLAKHEHNITKAAEAAGVARRYFYTIRARRGR